MALATTSRRALTSIPLDKRSSRAVRALDRYHRAMVCVRWHRGQSRRPVARLPRQAARALRSVVRNNVMNSIPPPAKTRFRPFRARLGPGGNIQIRVQLSGRAKGVGERLPAGMTEMSLQFSPEHARLLHGAIGAALEDAVAAGLLDEEA